MPRQIVALPMINDLEVSVAERFHSRSLRLGGPIEADAHTIDILKVLPTVTGSLIAQNCLSPNTLSLLLDDPIFTALVIISDFERLNDRLKPCIEDSYVACEIMCNYVRLRYPENREMVELYAEGFRPHSSRYARYLLTSPGADKGEIIRNIGSRVSKSPLANPGNAHFVICHDRNILEPNRREDLDKCLQVVSGCPATLFDAVTHLKSSGVSDDVWAKYVHQQRDPRWIFQYLKKSMCPYDSMRADMEEVVMESPTWGVEYLDTQMMEVDRFNALFRMTYEAAKGTGIGKLMTLWYQTSFPDVRRAIRAKAG